MESYNCNHCGKTVITMDEITQDANCIFCEEGKLVSVDVDLETNADGVFAVASFGIKLNRLKEVAELEEGSVFEEGDAISIIERELGWVDESGIYTRDIILIKE